MENLNFEKKKTGWENETVKYNNLVKDFIVSNYFDSGKYDSLTELHLSGQNSEVLTQVQNGEILPNEINVYYENGVPKQISVMYEGQGNGHNIDFYISGKALEDFLNK